MEGYSHELTRCTVKSVTRSADAFRHASAAEESRRRDIAAPVNRRDHFIMFYRGGRRGDPVPLDDIVALQILSEFCPMAKGESFRSYELNLVLTNHRRINVIDHGDPKQLRNDAEMLAGFLKVPLLER